MMGCYYLHTNGDLIYKPEVVFYNTTPAEYFESDFVVKWWAIPKKSPTGTPKGDLAWTMNWMSEAFKLSDNEEKTRVRIYEICRKQGMPDSVPDAITNKKGEIN